MPLTPLACLEMVHIPSQTIPPQELGWVRAWYVYPCFASTTGYKQEISTMEGGTVGQDCFHIILHGLNWAGHAVGDHGAPPQSEELILLWGGHYHYQRNWASSFIVLEKHQGTLRNIYCLGPHAAHGRGGGSGSRATAWHRPMHGPSSGCGREWWGWIYSGKSPLTDTWMMMYMYSIPVARGEACGYFFLALQHWRLCISRGSHDHVYGWSSRPGG